MEGDLYTECKVNEPGLQRFSLDKMLAEQPGYIVFNGAVGSLSGDKALKAKVGGRVRIYFGVGGPNIVSSFDVIGEIFDEVHPEGEGLHDVQTTLVRAGGATCVDFTIEVPGNYILVDHRLSRLVRGAAGFITVTVTGADAPHIFKAIDDN